MYLFWPTDNLAMFEFNCIDGVWFRAGGSDKWQRVVLGDMDRRMDWQTTGDWQIAAKRGRNTLSRHFHCTTSHSDDKLDIEHSHSLMLYTFLTATLFSPSNLLCAHLSRSQFFYLGIRVAASVSRASFTGRQCLSVLPICFSGTWAPIYAVIIILFKQRKEHQRTYHTNPKCIRSG